MQWKEELQEHEVLVIVAQIFLDLILHNRISLKDVNLLILDECHHATGSHPMREIMRQYGILNTHKPELCPRVLGLTACVIHRKCKVDDVKNHIKELEKTMCSALETSVDTQAVKKHTTAAREVVICFAPSKISGYTENIEAQLIGIKSEIDEMFDITDKQKKILIRKLDNISEIMHHLGDWCGARAVRYEMEHFEEAEEIEEIPVLRNLKKLLCQRLDVLYKYCCNKESNTFNNLNHVSKKVQRLFEVMSVCKQDACVLIFVERRNTAKLLYELLLESAKTKEELSFIRPTYVISANSRSSTDINLLQNELKKQKETLLAFSRGESNLLIATSVLEEGLDVRKCNVVIRFDKPLNFRSYVQSRGRARAIPAKYILMVEENLLNKLLHSMVIYKKIEAILLEMCHNRELPTTLETNLHFAEDEHVPPYQPYGPDGPRITFNSAISLINVYCGKLPQDKFTELVPETTFETSTGDEEGKFIRAGIKLPINSCLKNIMYGEWMKNQDHAKKSAAMAVCKKLHEMNELNDQLRPAGKSDRDILDGLMELPTEESTERGMPEPGTKKRRQVYNKEIGQALSSIGSERLKLYSVIVKSKPLATNEITIDSERTHMSVGLLCKETVTLMPLPYYSPKWDEAIVKIQLIDESLQLDSEIIDNIEHFHKVVFETLLNINPTLFNYFPQKTNVLILPMIEGQIDISLLSDIASRESLRMYGAVTSSDDMFKFERSVFEDAIIYPFYVNNSEPMFYVTNIVDHMSPRDKFPLTSRDYETFEEYYLVRYGRNISNNNQPLLAGKHLPKDLNNLKKFVRRQPKKTTKQDCPLFVPELCCVLPLKASLWWQIMLMPSVLHRLNSLCLAEELNNIMTSPQAHVLPKCHYNEADDFDFDWSSKLIKKLVQPSGNNLSVILNNAKPKPIHPFMILNALTLRGANDNFDIERLEVLGDSFLKYAVAEYLFLKFPLDHEGILSQLRSKLVSNSTLYSLGKVKQIPQKMQCSELKPDLNGILPGFILKPEVERKLQEVHAPFDMWSKFADFDVKEFLKVGVNSGFVITFFFLFLFCFALVLLNMHDLIW